MTVPAMVARFAPISFPPLPLLAPGNLVADMELLAVDSGSLPFDELVAVGQGPGGPKIVENVDAGELADKGSGRKQPSKLRDSTCMPLKSMHCPSRIAVALSLQM